MPHLLLALAAAATLQTRLGVVVQGDDATSRALLAACPALAVFPLPSGTAASQIAGYRRTCPGGVVVVQLGGTTDGAADFFAQWPTWLPQLQALDASLLGGVEGPPDSPAPSSSLVPFWTTFAQVVSGAGFFPVVDATAPAFRGSPADGGGEDGFCSAARALRAGGTSWGWSWHAVSPTTTTDPAVEASTTLGFRAVRDSCGLSGIPLFLTALRPSRAWQAADLSWLAWVDGQLALDAARSDLRGAAAVEAGAAGLFDLTPISEGLARYLANPQPVDAGSPDGGSDAGSGDAGAGDGGIADGGDGGAPDAGGGVISPVVPSGGPLVPGQQRGCSCSAPGAAAVALAVLVARRRRARPGDQGLKR